VAGRGENGAFRSLEARCTVQGVLVLVGGLSGTVCEARLWAVAGGGVVEYRRSQEDMRLGTLSIEYAGLLYLWQMS